MLHLLEAAKDKLEDLDKLLEAGFTDLGDKVSEIKEYIEEAIGIHKAASEEPPESAAPAAPAEQAQGVRD